MSVCCDHMPGDDITNLSQQFMWLVANPQEWQLQSNFLSLEWETG